MVALLGDNPIVTLTNLADLSWQGASIASVALVTKHNVAVAAKQWMRTDATDNCLQETFSILRVLVIGGLTTLKKNLPQVLFIPHELV